MHQNLSRTWIVRILLIVAGALGMAVAGLALLNAWPRQRGLDRMLENVSAVDNPQFRREAAALLGSPLTTGNAVADFQNGEEFFPAMLADIRAAHASITLESYIFRDSAIGREFVAALAARARAGVKVHVLADRVGSRHSDEVAAQLRAAGVEFHYFRPFGWNTLASFNNRTHRKLLIVDGRIGWTGGFGIDDAWTGDADIPGVKRDMMFRVQGPVVAQMQGAFERNWILASGRMLLGPDYFPALHAHGDLAVQLQASAPRGGRQNAELMFLLAIQGARSSIDMEASYFVPDALMRKALLDARARGVRVRVVMPGPYVDSPVTGDASQACWGAYLEAGVQFYRFQPSMFHSKLMIVDHYLVIGGSSNFDYRSFNLNDESDLMIYDRRFAQHMTDVFDADIARSSKVSLREWRHRPWTRKVVDWFWQLTASQL